MRRIVAAIAGTLLLGAILGLGAACRKAEDAPSRKGGVTSGEVREKAREALEVARAYTAQEREEYRRRMEDKLAEVDRRIEALKGEAEGAGDEVRSDLDKKLRKLKRQQKAFRKKLKELESATGDAWADLKIFLDRAARRIEKSIARSSRSGEGR